MIKVVVRNILYSILLFVVACFFALVLSFQIFQLLLLLPGDPVRSYLIAMGIPLPSPAQYAAAIQSLGLDQPLIDQFFRFLSEFFTGNLGISVSIARGSPISELLAGRIPVTIEFTILPIVLGIIGGILLGLLSVKVRYKLVKVFIQILVILGISMPLFVVGMWFQYTLGFQLGLFPVVGDPFLPASILFLFTFFLTTRQVRSNYLKNSEDKHILSNNLQIIFNISVLIACILILEVTFGLPGFFSLFLIAIAQLDYFIIRVYILIIILLPTIILFLSNIVYTTYNYFSEKSQSKIFTKYFGRDEQVVEEGARYDFVTEEKNKDYIFYRLKSPLTIIGLAIVIFTIIIAVFPQVLTPFSIQEASGIYVGQYDPPSETHPLGQTNFGRDVLALLAYGISTTIRVCALPVLIGIAIGVLFGYLSKIHRWVKGLVLGFMLIIFIIPSVLVILLYSSIFGGNITMIMGIMALYVIPLVTLLISRGNYSLKLTAKKIVTYFPLFMGFNILLFEAIGFLGFTPPQIITLGNNISSAREYLFIAPWASLWPGLALYVLVMGFFTLHYGLKEPIPIVRRS